MQSTDRRTPRVTRLAAALGVVVVLSLATACGGGSKADPGIPIPSASLGQPEDFAVPTAIENLPLTLPNGKTTTLASYKGKPVMIADFLSLCQDICPLITANTVQLAKTLQADGWGDKTALLEISVDPQRDTPARLRAYQKLYGSTPSNWTTLRATPANTKTLWHYLGVEYGKVKEEQPPTRDWLPPHEKLTYDVTHSDDLIFIDAQQHVRFIVNADPDVQGKLPPKQLVKFLDGQGIKSLYHPDSVGDWTVAQGLSVFSWLTNHRFALGS